MCILGNNVLFLIGPDCAVCAAQEETSEKQTLQRTAEENPYSQVC